MSGYYYKQNRLKQLRAFCFAARTGSISKAAGRMLLSQPAASLLIQALEKELGNRLFDRQGPRIRLTREGEILLELALPLIEAFDGLPDAFLERCHNRVSGNLVIAAGETATSYLLPGAIQQFTAQYPQIHLKLINSPGDQALALVQSGEADFAVDPVLEIPDDVYFRPLISAEPVLITPPNHPLALQQDITLEDISRYGLILPPLTSALRPGVERLLQQHNARYNVLLEAGGWEVIKKYVETGLGISIVSSICLTGKEKIWRLSLQDYLPAPSYGIILRRSKYITPAARRFVEIIDAIAAGGRTAQKSNSG